MTPNVGSRSAEGKFERFAFISSGMWPHEGTVSIAWDATSHNELAADRS